MLNNTIDDILLTKSFVIDSEKILILFLFDDFFFLGEILSLLSEKGILTVDKINLSCIEFIKALYSLITEVIISGNTYNTAKEIKIVFKIY